MPLMTVVKSFRIQSVSADYTHLYYTYLYYDLFFCAQFSNVLKILCSLCFTKNVNIRRLAGTHYTFVPNTVTYAF